MSDLKGLACGIGSLPLTDAQQAAELVLRFLPQIPFWPQLPKSCPGEGMLVQFSENLPGLKIKGKDLFFDDRNRENDLETFYDRFIGQDLEYFKISPDFAAGLYAFARRLEQADLSGVRFIKGQVTGPFTFCSGVTQGDGKTILHDEIIRQAMVKGLAMKALWQLEYFKPFGKPMIIFFDEPYLTGVGSAYTPVNREEVIAVYRELTDTLKSAGCLVGVHCCGNTDWSMLAESGIDIINFDAFNFQERFVLYADSLHAFLKKNGIICWGVVPTQEFSPQQRPELLAQKLNFGLEALVKKGVSRQLLLERLLISPACGLGTLSPQNGEGILSLLHQTSLYLRQNL